MPEEHKEKTDNLYKKLGECQKLKDEYLTGWQRERADFLNYKKEELERIGELIKFANGGLILKILPILDNFEIATRLRSGSGVAVSQEAASAPAGASASQRKDDKVIEGFLRIKNQLKDFLKSQGVEEIKAVGEKFDPNFHEVVEETEIKKLEAGPLTAKEPGIIVEEIQKGYKINGRLLRPAKVKIAK